MDRSTLREELSPLRPARKVGTIARLAAAGWIVYSDLAIDHNLFVEHTSHRCGIAGGVLKRVELRCSFPLPTRRPLLS